MSTIKRKEENILYKELRKKYNLSQEQFAEKIKIQQSAISKVELGKTQPNFKSLQGIYRAFGINEVEELLKRED
jgi:transcriptional regulator with XRE-family HTH domain